MVRVHFPDREPTAQFSPWTQCKTLAIHALRTRSRAAAVWMWEASTSFTRPRAGDPGVRSSDRLRFLSVARKHESGGMTEPAVEAYVRYVLTGAHKLDGAKAIAKFLRKARGFGKLEVLSTL